MNQDNNSDSFKSESDNLNATNVESLFSNNSENTSSNMQYTQNNNANAIETLGNINEENTSVEKVTIKTQLSKCGKVMMYIILVCTLLIVFDNLITSSDWYTNLYIYASINRNELVRTALKNLKELIEVVNWLLILVLTIINAIFFFKDKKRKYYTNQYSWYILAGILNTFGFTGLTPILYTISTLVFSITNIKRKDVKNKSDKVLVVTSSIVFVVVIFIFIAMQTNLFYKIKTKYQDYQDNKEVQVDDKDNSHIVTTFDKIINDWGNDVTKNKSFKIQNVKLRNVTAALYIDYTNNMENNKTVSTITIKHGDNKLYSYTSKEKYLTLSYLKLFDDLIIYGANYCDDVTSGKCNKHQTFSHVLALNNDSFIILYDGSLILKNGESEIYNDTSVFLEDENVYAKPYNDFRVYDIKINNGYIYFYTVAENYDEIFNYDYLTYDNNCNNMFWIAGTFDMQRTFKTKFIYDKKYRIYKLDSIVKQSSIKYSDYCTNKNVFQVKS